MPTGEIATGALSFRAGLVWLAVLGVTVLIFRGAMRPPKRSSP